MTIPTDTHIEGINNPTATVNLSEDQTFTLSDDIETFIIVNMSEVETVNVLIKGTRDETDLSSYGSIDISGGLPLAISPGAVATTTLALMYKHIGENGDEITVSSSSTDSAKVICWLCK